MGLPAFAPNGGCTLISGPAASWPRELLIRDGLLSDSCNAPKHTLLSRSGSHLVYLSWRDVVPNGELAALGVRPARIRHKRSALRPTDARSPEQAPATLYVWIDPIGIGGSLAAPPLPHHLAYGSVPRRFEKLR